MLDSAILFSVSKLLFAAPIAIRRRRLPRRGVWVSLRYRRAIKSVTITPQLAASDDPYRSPLRLDCRFRHVAAFVALKGLYHGDAA